MAGHRNELSDGELASTLPKLVDFLKEACPSIYDEKFDKKKCMEELEMYYRTLITKRND